MPSSLDRAVSRKDAYVFRGTAEKPDGSVERCWIRITEPRSRPRGEFLTRIRSSVRTLDRSPVSGASRRQALQLAHRLIGSLLQGWILRDARSRRIRLAEPAAITATRPGRPGTAAVACYLKRTAKGYFLVMDDVDRDESSGDYLRPRIFTEGPLRTDRQGRIAPEMAVNICEALVTRLKARLRTPPQRR